jgi:hypothetical protein
LVATHLLLAERAEALERLRDTLAGLDGADAERVAEIHARGRAGQAQVTQEYLTGLYLEQIADVLAAQQERIEELERRLKQTTKKK